MLGFLPGFLYLSGLDDQLHCPRKDNPSLNVPAGAVGIGGMQRVSIPLRALVVGISSAKHRLHFLTQLQKNRLSHKRSIRFVLYRLMLIRLKN